MDVCVCTHVQEPAEARSGCWSSRAGHDAADLSSGPLGEPEALLTAESSLQSELSMLTFRNQSRCNSGG